jgi:uncharacterized Zn finger protein
MYYGFAPYVSVAKKLSMAKKYAANKHKSKVNPIALEGKKISTTFWGNAWCDNLENYAEMLNRLERGRTYVRNGSVVHIGIKEGSVKSIVAGSEPYEIEIKIDPLDKARWEAVKKQCAGSVGSVVELLQGKLSKNVLAIVTDKKKGLFPSPKEIHFECSCPDAFGSWMCKHIAATLYGVGSLLDKLPELFFKLRGVDHLELIDTSVAITTGKKDSDSLDESSLEAIFGIELSDSTETEPQSKPKKKMAKKTIKKAVKKATRKVVKKKAAKKKQKVVKKTVKKTVRKAVKTTKKTVRKKTGR